MKKIIYCLLIIFTINSSDCSAIVNGFDIDKKDNVAEYVVALQMPEINPDNTIYYHKGTGVIISDRLILTAGHNFFYLVDPTKAEAIFDQIPVWGDHSANQIRIRVKNVIIYPDFRQTDNGTEDDLAILLLDQPIPQGYSPIAMASSESRIPSMGEEATLAGYGTNLDITSPPSISFRLRKINKFVSSFSASAFLNSKKIWFDQSFGGICAGDSGGPAIFNNAGKPTVYAIAIHVSHTRSGKWSCLTKGAFTNIVYYRNWIEKASEQLSNVP